MNGIHITFELDCRTEPYQMSIHAPQPLIDTHLKFQMPCNTYVQPGIISFKMNWIKVAQWRDWTNALKEQLRRQLSSELSFSIKQHGVFLC